MATSVQNAYRAHKLINQFKLSKSAEAGGINYANVIATQLYDESILAAAKRALFALFYSAKLNAVSPGEGEILVFYSSKSKGRHDYDFVIDALLRAAGEGGAYVEVTETLNPFQIFRTMMEVLPALKAVSGYRAHGIDRLCAALLIAKYRSYQSTLASLLLQRRRLVTFCDAFPLDNLIAQMAKVQGVHTVTAQHGQYRLLDKTNMSADAEAYANFVSDCMLCWGEATRAEFSRVGIERSRFCVTGWIRKWDGLSSVPRPMAGQKLFGVMLNGANGMSANLALLEAAKEVSRSVGLRYLVRAHPHTKLDSLRPLIDENCEDIVHMGIHEYLSMVSFSLGHMSGAIVEVLEVLHPTYLFDDGSLADVFRVDGLSYGDTDSILAAIRKDVDAPEEMRRRLSRLRVWYNDSSDQDARLLEAVKGGRIA
ncbi:hypothetical protein [uncultured Caulobacter sp.]|uniref:hypothetical protein n=1 Tax=uncultured Caulobacter sp. TaxID=158749 RepID=UPI0026124083|nr:hypothetical protein [uncultured Caulobacter sp.]